MRGELGVHIVSEVADREGVDPTELRPPLHDVVDPEALEALFEPTTTSRRDHAGAVRFSYCGYDVTVSADGGVSIGAGAPVDEGARTQRERAVE